jgi:ABC-type multidrug transport system ATPase subunit
MIHAQKLTKRYGTLTVLDDVSFTIQPGEAVALWGANGAGKTTTLRCLLGVHAFEGQLTINGVDVQRAGKAARALTGYVPQEAAFYDLTVWETLHFYARLKKVAATRIPTTLDKVDLAEHSRKRVSALSGGMKQRLALAVALLADPPVLILDEPTANLDVQAQRDFVHTIQALNQAGKTIIFSSHRLDEVLTLASRVLVLNGGKLALECKPHELADRLGLQRWLRIWVPNDHKADSIQRLRDEGFAYAPNGKSIYVRVNASSKMTPLRILERANIPIDDFEILESEPTQEGGV